MDLHIVIPKIIGERPDDVEKCKKAALNQWSESINVNVLVLEGTSFQDIFNHALQELSSGYVLFLFPWIILKDNAFDFFEFAKEELEHVDLIVFSYERQSFNQSYFVKWENESCGTGEFATEIHRHHSAEGYTCLWNKILSLDLIHKSEIEFEFDFEELYDYSFLLDYLMACKTIVFRNEELALFYTQPAIAISAKQRIREKEKLLGKYKKLLFEQLDKNKAKEIIDKEYFDYYIYEILRLDELSKEERADVKDMLVVLKEKNLEHSLKRELILSCTIIKRRLGRMKQCMTEDMSRSLQNKKQEKEKERELFWKENYYRLRWPVRFLHNTFGREKDILLYCESLTMKPHIMDYYNCVRGVSNTRFFIYYPDNWDNEVPDGVSLVSSHFMALNRPWDLLVCADADVPLYYNKREAGLIYINHGLHIISYDCGDTLYAYDRGKGMFNAMLEANKSYADMLQIKYPEENICYTGYKKAEVIRSLLNEKDNYKRELGFDDDAKVIAVFGSWGLDSLFHTVGKELIFQAEKMIADNYRFILSIHPKEYTKYDDAITPLGEYIESLAERGFVIRNPKEPSLDYMIAADVVICDYSSLCEEAMLAGKPIILSDFPSDRVWRHSIIAEYQKNGPTFFRDSDLRTLITKIIENEDLVDYSSSLVTDLMPPAQGYAMAVYEVTQKVLNGEYR